MVLFTIPQKIRTTNRTLSTTQIWNTFSFLSLDCTEQVWYSYLYCTLNLLCICAGQICKDCVRQKEFDIESGLCLFVSLHINIEQILKPVKHYSQVPAICCIYSRLSRRNTARGSSTGPVTVGPTKV